ncbi:hypothetical protein [Streptosporangium sp. CA-115845]|uniref:hypothetical protein n=1 Tax=Streptosporangium sp. CA-115845 TaxID=3240071 RepID=UPI003D8ACB25
MHFLHLRFPRVTSLIVLGGVLVALLLGWTAPAHAVGERLVDDYRSVYGTPGVAAAVIDGSSVETIVRGRDGDGDAVTARTRFRIASMSNPLTVVNAVLLGLTVGMAALLVTAAVRARCWASRRRAARRPWLVLQLVPLALVTVLGAVLPALIWGGAFNFQYWIVTAWLLPLLALFCLFCCVLGAVALGRRLRCFRRAGQAAFAPVRPATADS